MAYLSPSEYVQFGLSAETADAWVSAASAMVDAHCRRSSLGLTTYTERLRVAQMRGTAQLTYGPVTQVTTVRAKFSRQACGFGPLAEYASLFGLPGQWVVLDVSGVVLDASGELSLPVNLMGLPYSEVEVTYTAGFAGIPDGVKVAVAQIVKNAQATPGLNVKSSKLDTLQTEYFGDSLLDVQVRSLLRPYVAERLG